MLVSPALCAGQVQKIAVVAVEHCRDVLAGICVLSALHARMAMAESRPGSPVLTKTRTCPVMSSGKVWGHQ